MKNKKAIIITTIISFFVIMVSVLAIAFGINFYKNKSHDSDYLQKIESGYHNDSPNSANFYAKQVSMVQLIATPEKYHGELVRVIGVGNLAFESNCLSLSKDDLKYNTGNYLWIELGKRAISYEEAVQYNGEYVIVEGIFDKDDTGHFGVYRGAIKNISRYELYNMPLEMNSMVTQESDKTYSYTITDYEGRVLAEEKGLSKKPIKEYVDTDVVGFSFQAGTGLSTKYSIYYDLENSKISETFYYCLVAQDSIVIYAKYENNKHSIVVQDIFDKSAYYKIYDLENVSPVAADFVVDCKLKGNGCAVITYLTGEDYTETDITINFP